MTTVVDLPRITWASRVRFHPLVYQKEGDVYIVGRPDASTFIEIPDIGARAIRLLIQGASLEEARDRLQQDGQPPDVLDFVETLTACGLVAEVDGLAVPELPVPGADSRGGVEVMRWLRPEHVRWLVSRPALVVHAAVLPAIAAVLLLRPDQVPASRDFLWVDWFAVLLVGLVATVWLLIFVHEVGHLVAARAYGLSGRLSLGRRLYKVVAQTELDSLWSLPRGPRVVVYLAGIAVNAWIFLVALCLVTFWAGHLPEPLYRWLRLVLIFEWHATAWQFMFYMQTDVYYLIADLARARNLMEDAQSYLRRWLSAVLPFVRAEGEPPALAPRERRVVQAYAVFYVLGVGFAVLVLSLYLLPFMVQSSYRAIQTLMDWRQAGAARALDSVVILLAFTFNIGMLLRVLLRERWARRPRSAPSPGPVG